MVHLCFCNATRNLAILRMHICNQSKISAILDSDQISKLSAVLD